MSAQWIWYYGDFELYHSIKLHLRREEGNVEYPAFWKLYEPYTNIILKKQVKSDKPIHINVTTNGVGYILVMEKKYEFGKEVVLPAGEYDVELRVSNEFGLPAAYVEGDLESGADWMCDDYTGRWHCAGTSGMYKNKELPPDIFPFEYKEINPISVKSVNGGTLYDYGTETFAKVLIDGAKCRVNLGETELEALDDEPYLHTDYPCDNVNAKAFRYLFIPGKSADELDIKVLYEYREPPKRSKFDCRDGELRDIWKVAEHTFLLNSREFFLDGIKRDRWVWSGDAYQSYYINRYVGFDTETAERTIVCLGGKDEVYQHINTITDYTFYWIMSVYDHYEMTGNADFVRKIFPRMKAYMDFVFTRTDDKGFVVKKDSDWIFIDWADMDKDGTLCAEQFLFLRAMEMYAKCAELIGENCTEVKEKIPMLRENINRCFWNSEKGAFVDCYDTGKNNVTRHANIFALLFGYATEEQEKSIIDNVLLNDSVEQIKTPYFKFYEIEALCKIGKTDEVLSRIRDYWGTMLKNGATSFWEEFNPTEKWDKQLTMYDVKYDKSLCHAWGASPIYIIGRYLLGIYPTAPGYETFCVMPSAEFSGYNADIPIKDGYVHMENDGEILKISATRKGGVLKYKNEEYKIEPGVTVSVKL